MRLIDAYALSRAMYREAFETDSDWQRWDSGLWIRYKMFENALKNAPTIDAVPVVRCGECEHWHEGEWYNTCDKHIGHGFIAEHFCSDGERKTDERAI